MAAAAKALAMPAKNQPQAAPQPAVLVALRALLHGRKAGGHAV